MRKIVKQLKESFPFRIQYIFWILLFDRFGSKEKKYADREMQLFEFRPKISILMPVYETRRRYLSRAVGTVKRQRYQNWELCIGAHVPNLFLTGTFRQGGYFQHLLNFDYGGRIRPKGGGGHPATPHP